MKNKNLKQNTHASNSVLSSVVLDCIEEMTPSARWKFACLNYFVWIAWALSVVFGAVSVAVLIYVGDHARFALFEATHDTPLSFFAEVLPYVWIGTFVAMGAFAYFNMRHTKCGYRYPMWQLLISSVVFSVLGGVVLHIFGTGYLIDTQLAKKMPMYTSLERSEQKMWQKPAEGRLLGTFSTTDTETGAYMFIDAYSQKWSIQTDELGKIDRELLSSGHTVRVLGTTTDSAQKLFHACGVFPWLFDKDVSINDMRKERRVFIERMYEHMEKGDRLKGLEREVFERKSEQAFDEGLCSKLATVRRMKF